jgi:23S rRNA pseudouridine1911/1915/1917 synthase
MTEIPLQILFEDDQMLVINKHAGITVNRSETTKGDTVQDWSEKYMHLVIPELKDPENDFYDRGGVVHRLDKETSGVLVLAKTPESFVALQKQFKERVVEKKYQALAHGIVSPAIGEIKAPVGRLPWNRTQFGIVAGGRDSMTLYERISVYELPEKGGGKEKGSFLLLSPHTGRTHQIRVHLKYIGHPIFADFLYAGRKTARADRKYLERVFLHAASLSLMHPKTGEKLTFTAPLPEELAVFLSSLKKVE